MMQLTFTPKTDQDTELFQGLIDSLDYPYFGIYKYGSFYFDVSDQDEADDIEIETSREARMLNIQGYWEVED